MTDFDCCRYSTYHDLEALVDHLWIVEVDDLESRERLGVRVTSDIAKSLVDALGGRSYHFYGQEFYVGPSGQRYPIGGWLIFDDIFQDGFGFYPPIFVNEKEQFNSCTPHPTKTSSETFGQFTKCFQQTSRSSTPSSVDPAAQRLTSIRELVSKFIAEA